MNGKGYHNYNLEYELINSKGKIKIYNQYSDLSFEGEYVNGEKNGKGNEYHRRNWKNTLKFEGEQTNDKKNGYGKDIIVLITHQNMKEFF